jgi:hypothetical protein
MRDRHLDSAHQDAKPLESISCNPTGEDETVALLKALIKKKKIGKNSSSAKMLFEGLGMKKQDDVLLEVASCGTYDMKELLWSERPWFLGNKSIDRCFDLLPSGLASLNHDVLTWVDTKVQDRIREKPLYRTDKIRYYCTWHALGQCDEPETVYEQYLEAALSKVLPDTPRELSIHGLDNFFGPVITSTKGNPIMESILALVWKKEAGVPRKTTWSRMMSIVAKRTCSIKLANCLYDLGASVDGSPNSQADSPLIIVAQKYTPEAARFMRWLLYRGADPKGLPHGQYSKRGEVSSLAGPRGLHKWLGISWGELVEEAKEARRNNDNPPVPED